MKPKEQHPGQLVELSQRTTHRTYFWRPGKDTRALFGYMFGRALNAKGQRAHVACLLSNHVHSLQTDRTGRRSGFMQQAFSNAARKRNLQLDRREKLWAPKEPGDMAVLDLEKVVERVLYVALQPVAAGLVERAGDWTGFRILPRDWGKPMRFPRPDRCGRGMPEVVEFTPMPPPGFDHLPLKQVIAFFEDLIAKEERRYARKRKGRPVLGIEICEAMNPFRTPKTPSAMRTLNPRFTSSDKSLVARAIRRLREFQRLHRQALNAFRDGQRDVVFPAGTQQMALRAGVTCAECNANHPLATRTVWTLELQSIWEDWLRARRF